MKKKKVAVSVLVLLGACGGSPAAPLNSDFSGTWTTSLAVSEGPHALQPGELTIAVDGNMASVTKICLDGTGSLNFTGSGNSASYSGIYACAVTAFNNCLSVGLTLTSATASLIIGPEEGLTVVATGNASGCGQSGPLTLTFTSLR